MSTLKTVTVQADTWQNNAGNREYYKCQAWVNFNGTGTVSIRASGNVSSITDNGVGDYTINFTNAMVDANYALTCAGGMFRLLQVITPTVSAYRFSTQSTAGADTDSGEIMISVFR